MVVSGVTSRVGIVIIMVGSLEDLLLASPGPPSKVGKHSVMTRLCHLQSLIVWLYQ